MYVCPRHMYVLYINMYVCLDDWIVWKICYRPVYDIYVQILHFKNIHHLFACESTRKYRKYTSSKLKSAILLRLTKSKNKHWKKTMNYGLPCHGDFYVTDNHAGEAIIMLLGNYENFANVVAENIIKIRCIRIKWSMCIIYNQFWIHRLSNLQE